MRLEISTTNYPTCETIVTCGECKNVLRRIKWESYYEYKRIIGSVRKTIKSCPHCDEREKKEAEERKREELPAKQKTKIPVWEKVTDGKYIAKCLNGDFLVWKYGKVYRWRWRKYGREYPDVIYASKTMVDAKHECEKHKEWKLED